MNRPSRRNAMNTRMWREIGFCFSRLGNISSCRCVILTGAGKMFSAGIDLMSGNPLGILDHGGGEEGVGESDGSGEEGDDVARKALGVIRFGREWQRAWSSISSCGVPVIACIHGGCFGAALEMIAAADVRLCSKDAYFVAPEVDIGLAADIGGLQRFPKILGNDSLVRELMLTGRKLCAEEALRSGLVSNVYADHDALRRNGLAMAKGIAAKSPVATLGIKTLLNFSRDHSVQDSLDFALTWNAAMVQGGDLGKAAQAFFMKKQPKFSNIPAIESRSFVPSSSSPSSPRRSKL